ncbi:hypothetical protein LguiB_014139 [Lonicera macranthoides]
MGKVFEYLGWAENKVRAASLLVVTGVLALKAHYIYTKAKQDKKIARDVFEEIRDDVSGKSHDEFQTQMKSDMKSLFTTHPTPIPTHSTSKLGLPGDVSLTPLPLIKHAILILNMEYPAFKHPFVTGEPFTSSYVPAAETLRMVLGGNRVALHNRAHYQIVPYADPDSYGSLGRHGSYNDGIGAGSSYGSYGDNTKCVLEWSHPKRTRERATQYSAVVAACYVIISMYIASSQMSIRSPAFYSFPGLRISSCGSINETVCFGK